MAKQKRSIPEIIEDAESRGAKPRTVASLIHATLQNGIYSQAVPDEKLAVKAKNLELLKHDSARVRTQAIRNDILMTRLNLETLKALAAIEAAESERGGGDDDEVIQLPSGGPWGDAPAEAPAPEEADDADGD